MYKTNLFKKIIAICMLAAVTISQEHDDHDHEHEEDEEVLLTRAQVWGFGILAGIGVSMLGFLAAFVLVIAKKCCNETYFEIIIKFFFSLAFGALIGDAIVHIMAEAYEMPETNNNIVSLIFILSIVAFIFLDRILHSLGIAHSHWVDEEGHGPHDHEHKHDPSNNPDKLVAESLQILPETQHTKKQQPFESQLDSNEIIGGEPSSEIKKDSEESSEKVGCLRALKGKGASGYMNLIGSFIHNFIDGLATGVAFATGRPSQIVPVIVAIIVHEIPRELGDVAILLKASFSTIQTVLCNGCVNFVSLIGVVIGLAVVNLNEVAQTYIMVFVAGNFMYIASDIWQNLWKNKGDNAKIKNLIEFIGAAIGVGAMFALLALPGHSHSHGEEEHDHEDDDHEGHDH